MATDLSVTQLLEISKVEGLDGKAVLQSIGAAAPASPAPPSPAPPHAGIVANAADASYVFLDDPPPPDQPQSPQPHQQLDVDLQLDSIQMDSQSHTPDPHHMPHAAHPAPPQLVDQNPQEENMLPSDSHVHQLKSVSDESTTPVTQDMDIAKAQPDPGNQTEDENMLVEALGSDLHSCTHGQDKSVSDPTQDQSKEPLNEGTNITGPDSKQLDPNEEVKDQRQLPQVLQSDSHRHNHGEDKADQGTSVLDAIIQINKVPVFETTEVDSNHPNLEEKVKEENKLPEVEEIEENKLPVVAEAVRSDSHKLARGEEKADEDKLVSDVIVEENNEPVIETNEINEVASNHLNLEEKTKEEKELQEVVEVVESVLHQLTHDKEKDNQDKSVPDVIVEEHKEPLIEHMDIVEPESDKSSSEEKVEDAKQVPEAVDAVESHLHQLARMEDKVDNQAKSDRESESIGDVMDSLEKSELHQPYEGDNKVGEINEAGTHIEAQENQSSQLPTVEACASEPLQVFIEGKAGEQNELESFVEVCPDTQISTKGAVESELSLSGDVKECNRGTLLDENPVSESSVHLEHENLESENVNCPPADLQVEIEAKSSTNEVVGELTTNAVEQTVLQAEILKAENEDRKKSSACAIDQNELELPSVNGHVQNTETSIFELKSETDAEDVSGESGEGFSLNHAVCKNLESEAGKDFVEKYESKSHVEDLKPEAELGNGSIEPNQSTETITIHDLDGEMNATNGFTEGTKFSADPVDASQSKSGTGISSPESLKVSTTDAAISESLISYGPVIIDESNPESINVKSIEIEGVSADSNGKSAHDGNGFEEIGINGCLSSTPEFSTSGSLGGANVDSEVEKKTFRFLIRIPRYNDDKIRNQIDLAQKKVEEKTRNRDAIRSTIQTRRATCGEYRDTFEAARSEERAAREALNAKRREMDSVQSVISRKKNANSVEDIDDRIRNMEHRIEHETVPLKEEKQLIREIKQMKSLREQLSSSLGQQTEVEPTSEERVKLEERHKPLKLEIDQCRRELSQLEGVTKTAWKIYFDENEKLKELQAQFRAADDLRQEAYIELQNLKKQLYEKNKYFRMYKEDAWKAEDYSSKGDREALHNLCINQVERIMELWNTNDEFRNEYISCNTMSTLRRLRTLDGRSLGPDEEAPLLRTGLDERVGSSLVGSTNKIEFPSLSSSPRKSVAQDLVSVENLEQKNHKIDSKSVLNLEQKNLKADSKSVLKSEQIYPIAKSKSIIKSAGLVNIAKTVSGSDEKQDNVEESKRAMEEEISARRAEELWKEKEAAKLKEQRRLEEKAKAKEAEERKRRNAEKAQARAELRAQKEAELREKEREKKARKKERKMAEATIGENATESSSRSENTRSETTQEPEIKEKPKTIGKRPQKPSLLAKQIKPKVVPPPLRNRNKKRMQQWMWILLLVVVITVLILLGNFGFSFKLGMSSFSF